MLVIRRRVGSVLRRTPSGRLRAMMCRETVSREEILFLKSLSIWWRFKVNGVFKVS